MNKISTLFNKAAVLFLLTGLSVLLFTNGICQAPPPSEGCATCTVLKQPCNESDGVLAVKVTSTILIPPLTFQYSYYVSGGVNSSFVTHSNVNALSDTLKGTQGCSSVYIYDNFQHSCSITNTGMLSPFVIDYPVVTPAICPATTGTAKITINSGAMPDTVRWYQNVGGIPVNMVGMGNPMDLPAGKYIALVSANGCRAYSQSGKSTQDSNGVYSPFNITTISNIKFSTTTTAANCKNGTASISNVNGGVAPYTYHWSNGATTAAVGNLTMGSYPVTVTDSQGCFATTYTYISQTKVITVTYTITKPTCLQNDGSLIAFSSGGKSPYTYVYSNGANGDNVCCLSGGTYLNIIATDANGCEGQTYAYIQSATPITVTYSTIASSCTAPTGSATLTINGGTGPYDVQWNTYPVQSGNTVSNLNPCTVGFKVTDTKGCVQSGSIIIPPQSTITASLASTNPVCPLKTGAVYANATGSNPPFTYLWNTGETKQEILDAPLGNYFCKITDKVGCSVTKYKDVRSVSPVNVSLSPVDASCLYANDGSIEATPYGGTAPYTYSWSMGQSGFKATGLGKGKYYVYVTDVNGCSKDNHAYVGYDANNDDCYCTIKGKVYVDLNNNCQFDTGENGVKNIMIHCEGFGYTNTDANGDYAFLVPTGNYILSESVQSVYPLADCQNNSVSVPVTAAHGCTTTVNFANVVNPLHDINIITTSINSAVRGFPYNQSIIVQNDGTISEPDIQLRYEHDGQLQYVNTIPEIFTQPDPINKPNYFSINTGFPTLSPGASLRFYTNYMVPTNIPLGTTVNFADTVVYAPPIANWRADYSPWNNVNSFQTTILGSFDPNFIEVLPKGKKEQGYIVNDDSVLTYIIHFQNSGSYYAENIVLTDTLDSNLDLKSLKPGYSDHDYTADITESGILKFTFKNIHLIWKAKSEIASSGLVTYSIKHKPNLADGTKIKSTASIYFDFNDAILTNTALNTILERTVGIKESKNSEVHVYPNPAKDELFVKLNNVDKILYLSIYDLTGRMLQKERTLNNSIQKISVNKLSKGIYFLELLKVNGEKSTVKFVKE